MKIKIYSASTIYRRVLDKMPSNILPIGLGKKNFPDHWLSEKKGVNILHLNKFYGEHSGIYWVWKNCMSEFKDNDWIGFCGYRKFWLNSIYEEKQKGSIQSLFNNLLSSKNDIFENFDVVLVQPIIYKNKNLYEDFYRVHKSAILERSVNYLNEGLKDNFSRHLNSNILYPLNMFITKKKFFLEYCENIFPWLEKCTEYCITNDLLKDYNVRLPAFLSERFVSFWFSNFEKKTCLSYARLGNFFLSEYTNFFLNPLKIPFTFRMYPTIHKY